MKRPPSFVHTGLALVLGLVLCLPGRSQPAQAAQPASVSLDFVLALHVKTSWSESYYLAYSYRDRVGHHLNRYLPICSGTSCKQNGVYRYTVSGLAPPVRWSYARIVRTGFITTNGQTDYYLFNQQNFRQQRSQVIAVDVPLSVNVAFVLYGGAYAGRGYHQWSNVTGFWVRGQYRDGQGHLIQTVKPLCGQAAGAPTACPPRLHGYQTTVVRLTPPVHLDFVRLERVSRPSARQAPSVLVLRQLTKFTQYGDTTLRTAYPLTQTLSITLDGYVTPSEGLQLEADYRDGTGNWNSQSDPICGPNIGPLPVCQGSGHTYVLPIQGLTAPVYWRDVKFEAVIGEVSPTTETFYQKLNFTQWGNQLLSSSYSFP